MNTYEIVGVAFVLIISLTSYAWVMYQLWSSWRRVPTESGRSPWAEEILPEGKNNKEQARQFLREDLLSAHESMLAFTDSAENWFWGPDLNDDIYKLMEDKVKNGMRIAFVVSEGEFDPKEASSVCTLAQNYPRQVSIFILPERPPVDFRVIDGKRLYMTHHAAKEDENKARIYWRSREDLPKEECESIFAIAGQYLTSMKPFNPINTEKVHA